MAEREPGAAPEVDGQERPAEPVDAPEVGDNGRPIAEQDEDQLGMMRELLEDTEPPSDEGDAAPTAEGDADQPEPTRTTERDPAEKTTEREAEPEPQFKVFEFEHKGKSFTQEVTPELYEALEAMKLTAQQFPHLQGKYTNALEQLANAGVHGQPTAGTAPGEGAPPSQPPREESIADIARMTPEQYTERFSPLVKQLTEAGYYGDDGEFAEAFPRMATTLALIEFVGVPALATLEKVATGWNQMAEDAEKEMFFTKLNTVLDEVSERGEGFEPLKDPKNRERFFGHLRLLGVEADRIFDGDFLAGQWRAHNHRMFSELERVATERSGKRRQRSLTQSRGASGGSQAGRAAAPAEGTGDMQKDMMRKLLEP